MCHFPKVESLTDKGLWADVPRTDSKAQVLGMIPAAKLCHLSTISSSCAQPKHPKTCGQLGNGVWAPHSLSHSRTGASKPPALGYSTSYRLLAGAGSKCHPSASSLLPGGQVTMLLLSTPEIPLGKVRGCYLAACY